MATNVGGNAEIVHPGINGVMVPPSDPDGLAAAIGELLCDPGRAAALGRAGREWVLEEGSFQTMAERYAQVYGQ